MKFDNTPTNDGGSYEKPKPGKYIGVLVGFAFVGTQPGGQYGPKKKCLLRWELHKRKGPSRDSKNFVHTVTQSFGATVRGENSMLKKCLESHGVAVGEGGSTDSHEWLGKAAWLDLEEGEKQYVNVVGVSKLDPDDDAVPKNELPFEHWEPDDGTKCPQWAAWAVARSTDYAHLAPEKAGKPAEAAVGAGVGAARGDDDDIPF